MIKKLLRVGGIIIVGGLIVALIATSFSKPSAAGSIWDTRTTIGNTESTNHYVMYTDIMCPYCDVFSREIMNHEEEFTKDYIEGKNILFEVRMTDFLYEYNSKDIENSRNGAEAIYCATFQDKFWEYYHASLKSLWDDYHSKGIGSNKTAPAITGMDRGYWEKVAKKVDSLDQNTWKTCYTEHQSLSQVEENTARAAKIVDGGLPYFKFNKFINGGFSDAWGWDYVKKFLDSGLGS